MEEEDNFLVKKGSIMSLFVPMIDLLEELKRENVENDFLIKMKSRVINNEIPSRNN